MQDLSGRGLITGCAVPSPRLGKLQTRQSLSRSGVKHLLPPVFIDRFVLSYRHTLRTITPFLFIVAVAPRTQGCHAERESEWPIIYLREIDGYGWEHYTDMVVYLLWGRDRLLSTNTWRATLREAEVSCASL